MRGNTNFSQNNQQSSSKARESNDREANHAQTAQTGSAANRSKSGGDQSDLTKKLAAMVTQVPQGALNPQPVTQQTNTPKYRSKTQGQKNQMYTGQQRPGKSSSKGQNFGMLGPVPDHYKNRKTLVLDLDETLVHSQFQQIKNPDYVIPVNIDGNICNIFVQKRPGVDKFLKEMSQYYEVVIFTASLSKYADPLMNQMDPQGICTMRLFREHCTYLNGVFTKDMSKIGRNMKDAMILDNSPSAYMLQPECAMPIISWYDDPKDRQLYDLIPLFKQLSRVYDCREAITKFVKNNMIEFNYASQICSAVLDQQERIEREQKDRAEKIEKQRQSLIQDKIKKQQDDQTKQEVQLQNQNKKQSDMRKDESGDEAKQKRKSKKQEDEMKQGNFNSTRVTRPTHEEIAAQQQITTVQEDPSQSAPQGSVKTGNQKMRSIDVQKPLINPWTQNQSGAKQLNSKQLQQQEQINLRNQKLQMQQQQQKGSVKRFQAPGAPGGAGNYPQNAHSSNENYQSGDPQQVNNVGGAQGNSGVTNITNIIYNFNMTPQQLAQKQNENQRQIVTAGNQSASGLNGTNPNQLSQGQQPRKLTTQGGVRQNSKAPEYPEINQSNVQHGSPVKNMVVHNPQQMRSLDKSHNQQISQGIQIRDSYKEQQAQIQNQIKRRPQTGGNNGQVLPPNQPEGGSQSQSMNIQNREFNQLGYSTQEINEQTASGEQNMQKTSASQQQVINKRSISGASNKNQFNFNAVGKGQSSTPKNQNFSSGMQFRPNHTANYASNGNQRLGPGFKNMTQQINIKDHLPSDLRAGANQGSLHHQRLYMAQQKLAKQLKLNTNTDSFLRYGHPSGAPKNSHQIGNITTTAAQQKGNGPILFNFQQQSPQNVSGYSVGANADRNGANRGKSNKQRSHSSSNNAGINQNNMVFLAGGRQGGATQGEAKTKDVQNQIIASGKQYTQQIGSHGRNNSSDVQGNRRQDDFIKDQRLQAAENAIADQYATAMLNSNNRGQFMTNQNEADGEGLAAIGAMSQSYRNVGAGANRHQTMSNTNNQNTTSQYERVRNSYQSPTNKYSGNINTNMQMGSFQKSPKMSTQGGIKSMKIGGAPGTHGSAQESYNGITSGTGYGTNPSKNVRIVLVGNSGKSTTNKFNDQQNSQFHQGLNQIQAGNLPKTTKHGMSKFYSGGQDMSVAGGSYIHKGKNTFRNDGVQMMGSGGQGGTMPIKPDNLHENLNMRQSAQIGSPTSASGQAYSNVQFSQGLGHQKTRSMPQYQHGPKKIKQEFVDQSRGN